MYSLTTATKKIAQLKGRIRVIQGGTSASKTISILLHLIHLAQSDKAVTLTSIVSESVPHLKRGAMRDFKLIMQTQHYWKEALWNATDSVYTFETGSKIEFFSTDNGDKLRGARRDRLFINEANNVPFDAFEQLEVRTREFVYIDFNPTNEFWFFTEVKPHRDDVDHIILTYKDNEALSPEIIASIEARRNRTNWWKVYGLGQLGEVEGRIYTGWLEIDAIPHEAKLIRYGLDFGYSNDPASLVAIYSYNGGYIVDELLYLKGQSNKQLADVILAQPEHALVVADSSEPKSIDEIKSYGVSIVGAKKKKENTGRHKSYNAWAIEKVQDCKMSITKRSVNGLKEYRNYLWMVDKEGRRLNEPEDFNDHFLDALKYGIVSLLDGVSDSVINRQFDEFQKNFNLAPLNSTL